MQTLTRVIIAAVLAMLAVHGAAAERLRLATTTSTENSGLLAVLNPPFEEKYGVDVHVIAVGTGAALRLGERGDVDVLMVHAPAAEKRFMAAGFGKARLPVMHNDFVLLGPPADPAGVREAASAAEAMRRIARAGAAAFVSRGDDSGTHKKELSLWSAAGVSPAGQWYLPAGQSMGAVIRIADDKQAYTLADRGTCLAYRGELGLEILLAGDEALYNPYHVILLNEERHPHIRSELAERYAEFVRGPVGQRIIRGFTAGGEQLFHPDVIP